MTKDKAVISAWSLREVYFDEDGEPSMHRSPPAAQRPWQGLTDKERKDALVSVDVETKRLPPGMTAFARAVEAKLKERNHG